MKFFFDRNVCVRTARILSVYEGPNGCHVRHHNDDGRFTRTSPDTEIIKTLYDEDPNWIFVGGDGKIMRNKAELLALRECNLTYLFLHNNWCNKRIEDTCWMMLKIWPRVKSEISCLKQHSILELKYTSNCSIDNRGPTAAFRSHV
ncbi:MAG: hypothetical protein ABS79_00925 [Planctomycetes bacterium SCN 63-9]|nr:MAG: hypothetical protein ABS79_00925 [Planctomycetes bacterium SCN 63-9]